jgi:hypothetical protein
MFHVRPAWLLLALAGCGSGDAGRPISNHTPRRVPHVRMAETDAERHGGNCDLRGAARPDLTSAIIDTIRSQLRARVVVKILAGEGAADRLGNPKLGADDVALAVDPREDVGQLVVADARSWRLYCVRLRGDVVVIAESIGVNIGAPHL